MSVLALVFFSDLQATLRTPLSRVRRLLATASTEPPPAVPRGKPHLLRDAGIAICDAGLATCDAGLVFHDAPAHVLQSPVGWRHAADRNAVNRSHWML